MLEHNIIEPSRSHWASSVFLIPKRNNRFRARVDLRRVNQYIQADVYTLPVKFITMDPNSIENINAIVDALMYNKLNISMRQ